MTPKQLKKWRQDQGLTQVQAAKLLGVDQSQVARWEQGSRRIPRWADKLIECLKERK